jgi:hypothetical protein
MYMVILEIIREGRIGNWLTKTNKFQLLVPDMLELLAEREVRG